MGTVTHEECEAILALPDSNPNIPLWQYQRLARAHIALLERCSKAEHDLACYQIDHSKCGEQKDLLFQEKENLREQLASAMVSLDECENLRRDKERLHKDLWLVLDCFAAHCEMTDDLDEDGPLIAQIRADHPREAIDAAISENARNALASTEEAK